MGPTQTASRSVQRNTGFYKRTVKCCKLSYFPSIFCEFLGLVFGVVFCLFAFFLVWVFCVCFSFLTFGVILINAVHYLTDPMAQKVFKRAALSSDW